jgi:hypothetical protein
MITGEQNITTPVEQQPQNDVPAKEESVKFEFLDRKPNESQTQQTPTEQKSPEATGDSGETVPPVESNANPTNENTDPTTQTTDSDVFEVTDEDLGSILGDATQGAIQNVEQLHQILEQNRVLQERLQAIEKNPVGVLNDPHKEAIAKFLFDYKGGDFHTGIQTYAKLHSLNIAEMDAEDALREDYVMSKTKAGLSRSKAEEMFNFELENKKVTYGDQYENFLAADAFEAKQRLSQAKSDSMATTPQVDDLQAQKEQEFTQARERFEQSVEQVFKNEKGEEYKSLSVSALTDNPEDDFNFEIKDADQIKDAMYDWTGWFNQRYASSNGANTELMKQDLTIIHNFPEISQQLFEHGKNYGIEQAIKERQNIPSKKEPAPTKLSGNDNGIPQNWEQAFKGATFHATKPS